MTINLPLLNSLDWTHVRCMGWTTKKIYHHFIPTEDCFSCHCKSSDHHPVILQLTIDLTQSPQRAYLFAWPFERRREANQGIRATGNLWRQMPRFWAAQQKDAFSMAFNPMVKVWWIYFPFWCLLESTVELELANEMMKLRGQNVGSR